MNTGFNHYCAKHKLWWNTKNNDCPKCIRLDEDRNEYIYSSTGKKKLKFKNKIESRSKKMAVREGRITQEMLAREKCKSFYLGAILGTSSLMFGMLVGMLVYYTYQYGIKFLQNFFMSW